MPDDEDEKVYTGTTCGECGADQYETASGVTCENGHGGAPAAEDDEEDLG